MTQALLNSQADDHFGAPSNARGIEWPKGYRSGFKAGGFQTLAGALEISVLQARNASFHSTLFERWRRLERAMLAAACGEMVLAGVSNRNVSRLAELVFGAEESSCLASQLVQDLVDPAVKAFNK